MALDTAKQISDWVLNRADEFSDGTSAFQSSMQNILTEVWRQLYLEEPWLGLRAYPPQAFVTQPASKTLLLTTTANLATASLNAAPTGLGGAAVSIANWWIMPTGKTYYLRVAAHAAGALTATLDTVAPETLAAVGCVIAQLEYSLVAQTGVLADALWAEGNGFDGAFVPIRSEEELKLAFPGIPQQDWPPSVAARITPRVIRFSHYDLTAHRVEIPYNQELDDPDVAGGTELPIPRHLRLALAEGMLAILYEMKGDVRRPLADARYQRWVAKAKDYEMALKIGRGDQSQQRRSEPYGDGSRRSAPYA